MGLASALLKDNIDKWIREVLQQAENAVARPAPVERPADDDIPF